MATAIVEALAKPFDLGEHLVGVSASVGVALSPADGLAGADLLGAADAAMYAAKRSGKNRYALVSPAPLHWQQTTTALAVSGSRAAVG